MKKWEYKIFGIPRTQDGVDKLLNDLGGEGWELITIESTVEPTFSTVFLDLETTTGFILIFKREKQS